jgi:hypothetical protein
MGTYLAHSRLPCTVVGGAVRFQVDEVRGNRWGRASG